MQMKFGDDRFRLDERFAEDTDDSEDDRDVEKKDDNSKTSADTLLQDDLEQEKQTNMAILESILGRSVNTRKKNSQKK